MGFFRSLVSPVAFSRTTEPTADAWYDSSGWMNAGSYGASINLALHLSAVMACTRAIAQPTAMVPLHILEYMQAGGRRRAPEHPLYSLLHDAASPEMTAQEFREYIVAHAFLRGAGYARILPDDVTGYPIGKLVPIHSDHVIIERLPSGKLRYRVQEPGRPAEVLLYDEVFKVRGLSVDGVTGVSFVEFAARTMRLSNAIEEYQLKHYTKGGAPRGILQHKVELGGDTRKKMEAEFAAKVTGMDNMFATPVLPPSLEWKQIGVSDKDAETLGKMQFQLGEYERWSGVPAHVIADLMRSTNNNIEEQAIEYVQYCLLPWGVRVEQSVARDLITNPRRFRAEHLWDVLLKGQTKERYEAYNLAWWMSINEKRERENMNPVEGGDDLIVPLNMTRLRDLGADAAVSPPPALPRENPRARLFALDAARRVVTQELRAVEKAALEHADDGIAWERWLREFYGRHERQYELILRLPAAEAHEIAERHRLTLLRDGARAAESWEEAEVPVLAGMALHDGAAPQSADSEELVIVRDADGRSGGAFNRRE